MEKKSDCIFCDIQKNIVTESTYTINTYANHKVNCAVCGSFFITEDAIRFIDQNFKKDIHLIQGYIRYRSGKEKHIIQIDTKDDVENILKNPIIPRSVLNKLDVLLLYLESKTSFGGEGIHVDTNNDYPIAFASNSRELNYLINQLVERKFINKTPPAPNKQDFIILTTKGWEKIDILKSYNKDSKQCFVAMWFTDEMNEIYKNIIKPAIEFKEEGEDESRFRAIKIDDHNHLNDINDEIIAQIRRSRFMVCDLTGYRGGVYFEAGFAKGLGLDVIYTCRKDWIESETFKDENDKEIKKLFDKNKQIIEIKKEGVHFDLNHINRIEWDSNDLEKFKKELTNRIKANII